MKIQGLGWARGSCIAAVAISGCGGSQAASPLPAVAPQAANALFERSISSGSSVIQHVVIIIQENRSLDNLFYGYPKADTRPYGYNERGEKIDLKPVGLQAKWDVEHDSTAFFTACNGTGRIPGTQCRMDGFDEIGVGCGGSSGDPRCPHKNPVYSYVPHGETIPYFAMAQQYVLGDRMFASDFDLSSFVSHQYIIAAQADRTINGPSGGTCPGGLDDTIATIDRKRQIDGYIVPCFSYTTLGKELDAKKLSWRYYTSGAAQVGALWNAYAAVKYVYDGPDWRKDVIRPQTRFFNDIKNGKLSAVSWITPTLANSDHAGSGSKTGPSWVASLVNAIGESTYWNSTAIFVFWDEGGGWYDHVPPPHLNYDGLGMRVPLLVISAYAKNNYVSHVQYEHGSILKFIEERFGLPAMSASDMRANSPGDCFDFSQSPRKFTPIPAEYGEDYFLRQPLDPRPVDTQ
jgi:phospholipase C